ncbi:MAG: sulfatase-like hydrolase/transferase [Planctomycetes bacterium]|nr:sulfatase-like hydrolase/transferase [Planctomycetota bacterium]
MNAFSNKIKWRHVFINNALPKQFKISAIAIFGLLVCYALLRLGFFLANRGFFVDVSAGEILWSFIYGLRFDISALLMINGALLLLYNFPGNPAARWPWFRLGLLLLFWLANLVFIGLNLSDYIYFPTIQRRLMSEIYTILPDILRMLPSTLLEYYYMVLLLLAGGAGFVFASLWLFRKADKLFAYSPNILKESAWLVVIILLLMLGIRGGLQSRPIRPAHAFFSANRSTGYLTLNSSFTILRSLTQTNLPSYKLMPADEALKTVQAMLKADNEQILDPQYPFLRQRSSAGHPGKPNVVVFILESWTADYCQSVSGQSTAMPFFDSLTDQGMLFTNFLANGQRSIIAQTSILTSIPGFFSTNLRGSKKVMIGSQSEMNRFLGLGTILMKEGYATSFHHGAKTGSMGFDAYSRLAGFSNYYGKEDYPNLTASATDGTWGVWDEEFFLDSLRRMDGFKEPFCSVVFSLTSHDPFPIPERRQSLFSQYSNETKFQRVLRYTDYSLQQFFNAAQNKPWFKNTIFIITGDHTNYSRPNILRSYYHVPLLIYAPGIIKPQRCNQIGSQVDILPTILDLLSIPTVHASMGRSLLDTTKTHYAVMTEGAYCVIFDDCFVLLDDLEKTTGLFDYHADPYLKDNLLTRDPETARKLKHHLYAYIQEVTYAITNDKVCRDEDIKINKPEGTK